ncbi:hypothetical protein TCA2_4455 [Paenibacillus sp. TCA20]|uniref:3D domain-containing protein n=1 Tax=Paenibacillus urinalis TaxID=521520 RepID=A0ABY7XHF0_9BACL|nr:MULTISPECIES: 3D domain-containing protein [Paenibacillus]WDI05208.1 3D domain-containing protein [Paenibacillus urinalis]GAK41963.1 hypothetical protein TCA2_4455 [Paenibacillus sp. TCA20]
MKHRNFYTMGVINVLLAAALVTSVQRADSSLQEKRNTIHDLNQTVANQKLLIDTQQEVLNDQEILKKQNNELAYQLNTVKEKRAEENEQFKEQLEVQNRLFTQKIEKLSSEKEQAKQSANSQTRQLNWDEGTGSSYIATYYDANEASTGKGPGHPAYGVTFSGRKVEAGVTIAVDPRLIPIGSWVEVMYPDGRVEKRRADDTGGAIKGHKIDIYVPDASDRTRYGKHEVKVRIISTPEKL